MTRESGSTRSTESIRTMMNTAAIMKRTVNTERNASARRMTESTRKRSTTSVIIIESTGKLLSAGLPT